MLKKKVMINGNPQILIVDGETTLSNVLRGQMHLTGTKVGCGKGQCGACSVIMNGKVIRSCVTKMKRVPDNAEITTIEGVGTKEHLHPLQLAWMIHGAAQCGFCSPGFIVSAKQLLTENMNPSREEVRDWFQKHRNACRCTGYKPLVDAVMDAARLMRGEVTTEELWCKLPEDGRIWGSKYVRPSALAKVTGTWDFGADLGHKMPGGTLHLKLVQAKVSHANILSIDTSEAEKMPGVYRVITAKDVKGKNKITGLITFPTNKGDGWDRPILCDKKVFQFGDAIAIVAADTPEHAQAAVEKVNVELELLPEYMSAPAAMADDALEIHPGTPNVYFETKLVKGDDTAPLMDSADVVVEDDFYIGRQPHMPIEPDVGFAFFDEEGKLIIHSKSIGIHLHQAMICAGIGMEPEKLILVQNNAGGTFGYKFSPTIEALLGVAAVATGKPVYLEFDYYQQMTYTGKRSPFFINLKYGATKEGKLIAMESDWTVDHGPYSEFGDLLTMRGTQFIGCGYNIPNIRGNGRTVCTNHAWGSAFRGYGSPQSTFSSEVLIDELAEKLGMDPFDLRYKNVYRPGDTTPTGCEPDVYCLVDIMDKLKPEYDKAKEWAKQPPSDPNKKRGIGMSIGIYGSGLDGADSSAVNVELTATGVTVYTSWEDHGQGADMGSLATAHEALRPLGIKPENIKLVMNDMERTPNSGPAGGSRSQVLVGNATRVACEALLEGIKKEDGTFRTYEEMIAENLPVLFQGAWTAPASECNVETGQGNPFAVYMYGAFLSQVEVDTTTGKTTVVKMTMVADVGKIANRLVVDGQLYGGLVQGLGLALSEDFEDLKKHSDLIGAGLPFIKDVPDDIQLLYVETYRPNGPFGAAGSGELPLTSPHASIINAIYNACGVRVTHLPARPEKVLAGLQAKG
ncbi:aerobic-type carbon monoxide dehydrogenase, large subunit CoxL/CutL-like protein [Desulfosporosinus acidiphilus SJ4]|uniref:Aerobic-type carbon monoxide dehydrogenase, large subunit CoxL/CutL-like protein n=1 Tax=Desulfosporosinus acidiphilus (strain DSM 22704 / JCM 16185 / SJ4) TaxID=646529 RepID=I4D765_DESAJ|nr:molybdopterin-dependent aldehyde oxidoreductase [Desulfosporosinus acidiphilus]AFM41639.1 aerobic-type carbon monoxide dehydrogenase, large subunit CoxL/CutL-like protein [Desulfosporosinus acidiphilus SJ4]